MIVLKRGLPVALAILTGLAVLLGLLLFQPLANLLLDWTALLGTAALILGVINLFAIHARRAVGGNGYSLVLVLSMLAVFGLAVTDGAGLTQDGVNTVFNVVQAPLEAALASLLAFFLLFAGFRLMRHRWNFATALFLLAAVVVRVFQSPLPEFVATAVRPVHSFIMTVLVNAGIRGLLIGVSLGVVTLSLRLLAGLERPYSS